MTDLYLAEHRQCGALTALVRDLAQRLPQAQVRKVAKGGQIYRMGEATDHFYLLLEGRVRTSIVGNGGQEFILKDVGPGEAFGELCFCEVRARQEQAVAIAPSRVARIGLPELAAFADGEGLWQLVEMFTHRLADLELQLQEISTSPVRERLLHFLQRQATPAVDAEGFARLAGAYTHQEIASRIFTTREQVSAHLAALRRQGLVRYTRGQPIAVRLGDAADAGR